MECAGRAQRRPERYTYLQSQGLRLKAEGCDDPLFCVATLGNRCLKYFNLEEVAPLIPKVTLVPLQMVLPQQGAQFLLETHFRMMILLVPNVVRYLFEVGLADAEICLASWPLKINAVPCPSFEPGTGNTL